MPKVVSNSTPLIHLGKVGLRMTGTVGVLLAAHAEGRLQDMQGCLEQLADTGFRISDRLIRETLDKAAQMRKP